MKLLPLVTTMVYHLNNWFTDDFTELLSHLQTSRHPTYISGDFNINLLKTYQKHHYKHFFENKTACGFFPKISMPTRFTEQSATLIDNIFTNQLDNHVSGVLTNSISDHQMLFSYSKIFELFRSKLNI